MPRQPNFSPVRRKDGRWRVRIPPSLGLGEERTFPKGQFQDSRRFANEIRDRWMLLNSEGLVFSQEAAELVEYRRQLARHGLSIADACRMALAEMEHTKHGTPLGEVAEQLIASLDLRARNGKCSKEHVRQMRRVSKLLVEHFGADAGIKTVTAIDIENFMLEVRPNSYACFRPKVRTVFGFALKKRWTDHNPASDTPTMREHTDIVSLNPDQVRAIIRYYEKRRGKKGWSPFWESDFLNFVLRVFTGIRQREVEKLTGDDIDLDENEIYVARGKRREKSRTVTIEPNLAAFVKTFDLPGDKPVCPCWPYPRFKKVRNTLAKQDPPVEIPGGVCALLRHTFASHHWAHYRDAERLRAETGHATAATTFAHYRRLVKRSQGADFFSIWPDGAEPDTARAAAEAGPEAGKIVKLAHA